MVDLTRPYLRGCVRETLRPPRATWVAQVGLARFDRATQLQKDGSSLFTAPAGVTPQQPTKVRIMQGALEGSNVRGVVEMARMIDVTRTYSQIAGLLQQVGLADWAEQFPRQLSGGMQQRLQIARCLAQEPRLLLMDEPFGALDAMTRQTLQDELAQLARASGTTVVFVTHDLDEAIYLGDRVVAMASRPGRIADRIIIDLPQPRDQLTTREDARFLAHRHHLFGLLPRKHA